MLIMICDDENTELAKIGHIISGYSESHPEYSIEAKSYTNPFDMIGEISKSGAPDIALLDICMPNLLGTEIAREIKKLNADNTDIIFLTTSSDYAVEAYTLRASDYIKKPYNEKQLTDALDRIAESRQKHRYVLIKSNKDIHKIDVYSVVFAEAVHGEVMIHLKSGECLSTRMTLTGFSELFESLDGFAFLGASYFINFRCISGISQDTIEMTSKDSITMPRRLKIDFKNKLFEFYKSKDNN